MKKILTITIFMLSLSVFATEEIEYFKHLVQKKDTVSDLLYNLKMKPIYGPGNYLERTLVKNKLSEKKAKNLEKGDVLFIPKFLPKVNIVKKTKIAAFSPLATVIRPSIKKRKKKKKKIFIERDRDEYDINTSLTFFNRSTRVSWQNSATSGSEAKTFNDASNIGMRFQINSRKVINASGLKMRPNYALYINKVNESQELVDRDLIYKPAFKADIALALENYKSDFMINLVYQYEEMNTTDVFSGTIFSRRNYLNWAGVNISVNDNYFDKDFIHVFNVFSSLKNRSSADGITLTDANDKLIGGKLGYSLITSFYGMNLSANYELYMLTNDVNNYQISSVGFTLGKWF